MYGQWPDMASRPSRTSRTCGPHRASEVSPLSWGMWGRNGLTIPTAEIAVRELVLLGNPRSASSDESENDDDLPF
jgi:hypothetical protein